MTAAVEPDRVTALTEITTHAVDGLALLLQQFKSKPYVEAILGAWLSQVQELETAFFDLIENGLLTATNAQLDQIGDILGRPRGALSDDDYRLVLRATALAISSSGTGPELVAIVDILRKVVAATLTEPPDATVKVEPASAWPLSASLVIEVLIRAKAAGVRLLVIDIPSGDTFAFSSTTTTEVDAARGWSDTGGAVGGKLVGILEG